MSVLRVPRSARGYLRFVVVINPQDGCRFSIGVAHVLDTVGGRKYTRQIVRNVITGHRGHIEARLCPSVVECANCALGTACLDIHVTPPGWEGRRTWRVGQPSPHTSDESDNEAKARQGTVDENPPDLNLSLETEGSQTSDGRSSPGTPISAPSTPSTDVQSDFGPEENGCSEPLTEILQWHKFPGVFVRHRNQRKHCRLLATNVPRCFAPPVMPPHTYCAA